MNSEPNSSTSPIVAPTPEQGQSSTGAAEQETATVAEAVDQSKIQLVVVTATTATALAILLWAIRRRSSRRETRWEKAVDALQQASTTSRDRAGQLGGKLKDSDLADQAAGKARQAAAATHARPRVEGAAATIGAVLMLALLKRVARRSGDTG